MIKFKLEPEPVWIKGDDPVFDNTEIGDYSKRERGKIAFKIFPLTSSLVDETRKEHTTVQKEITFDKGRRVINKTEYVDEDAVANALIDKILRDWRGVNDEKGNEIECTPANKRILFDMYPMLAAGWVDAARIVNSRFEEDRKQEEETERKNLRTSQGGKSAG